ncbi:MAG TPA: alpha/beta hydrolase [Mesorhizobium sp.]|jgi:pimeloyl-ACP methyl ester carboxylesterase|uniref:alpha/beta fold hydrolase n=1 Tax=Mesorhizobium sp. TaxID=1871066 RepID=UPI002DDD7F0F|nr:alpha/beta hydrolase [Mesorhizobium sp.]HEV2507443.1 alpha/beta hydrolase [Mesorhizobium sp.]
MLLTVLLWLLAVIVLACLSVVGYFVFRTRRIVAWVERTMPPAGKFIDIKGNRIHYVDVGEGPPIVFLHGLGAQLHHFTHPLFKVFGPGYRLIALDRPGSGYSTRARGSSGRLPEQAEIVRAFMEKLGLEKPVIVGHSLGGSVALAIAVEHPEAISGLVLLAALTHREVELRPEFKALFVSSPLKRFILAHTVSAPAGLKYGMKTMELIFAPHPPPKDYMTENGGYIGLRPSHYYASATDFAVIEMDLPRLSERYNEITVPSGLLFGGVDPIISLDVQGTPVKEKIEGLELEVAENLGHMPQFIGPEQVASFIRRIAGRAFGGRIST